MKNKNFTWILKDKKGKPVMKTEETELMEVKAVYWGKLTDIIKLITLKEFKQMETLEIMNSFNDKVNHKPITKAQIERMLEEEN